MHEQTTTRKREKNPVTRAENKFFKRLTQSYKHDGDGISQIEQKALDDVWKKISQQGTSYEEDIHDVLSNILYEKHNQVIYEAKRDVMVATDKDINLFQPVGQTTQPALQTAQQKLNEAETRHDKDAMEIELPSLPRLAAKAHLPKRPR